MDDEKDASHADILRAINRLETSSAKQIGEVRGEVMGALGVVRQDVEALKVTAGEAKTKAEEADHVAKKAMVSHHALETQVSSGHKEILDRVAKMDAAQTPVITYVAAQIDAAKTKADAAEANARNESIAAKALAAKREYNLNLLKVLLPLGVAAIGVMQYVYMSRVTAQQQAQHADVTNQLSEMRQQVLQQRAQPSLQMQLPQQYPAQMAVTVEPAPAHAAPKSPAPAAAAPASPP